ncbi:PREDICTED: uncharacterized protein LOC107192368 [Dufourea novaeangliae]|uniref:uncharacterized protein LOC107192368 n=1 Tax=Dufourea novaeangliae TaxID=178035 RepID=UPI00076799BC|nr:PREDICTED: uncharacterized protein LOC107192368 [Dufourea novaeangliae]
MPAEIDTGGPRVLHCDYRADCPIPIVRLASTESSSLRRENKLVQGSIVRRLPRINSLDDGALCSRRCNGLPSRRVGCSSSVHSGYRGYRRDERCARLDVPAAIHPSDTYERDVSRPEQLESRLRGTSDVFDRNTIEDRGSTRGYSNTVRRYRRDLSRSHENDIITDDRHGERGCCSKRDFSAENWPQVRAADHHRTGEALFSSQSCDRHAWTERTYEKLVTTSTLPSLAIQRKNARGNVPVDATNSSSRESRVPKVGPTDDRRTTEFPRYNGSTNTSYLRDRTRKTRREQPTNTRTSYIQLAFLLFLVAFGQCGLRKSSVFNCSAKPGGGAGLSVLAIGTVISAVSAAPVDLTGDAGVRAERSANLSHITGASRKIQMYIKNRHLQILPDGTVNGSNDDTSDYSEYTSIFSVKGAHM